MKCLFCGRDLLSLGLFESFPCHFSYSEDAPDIITGEQFQCVNPDCEEYESLFYINDEHPESLCLGRPEGV